MKMDRKTVFIFFLFLDWSPGSSVCTAWDLYRGGHETRHAKQKLRKDPFPSATLVTMWRKKANSATSSVSCRCLALDRLPAVSHLPRHGCWPSVFRIMITRISACSIMGIGLTSFRESVAGNVKDSRGRFLRISAHKKRKEELCAQPCVAPRSPAHWFQVKRVICALVERRHQVWRWW